MNIDPNKLTDEQLRYFLVGVIEASPCMCNAEKKSNVRHIHNLPRKQLLLDAKEMCKYGWEMSDWLNLDSIRKSLKLQQVNIVTEQSTRSET